MNFHSAFTTQCVSFTQSDSLTHPQGWRSQSQVYKICVSSKSWIRLCASRHHHPPANNSSTTSHKIKLSVSAYRTPIDCQQKIPMVAHSAPRFPTSNRSTHAHYKRIATHPQQSANTHQLHRSHTLNFPHSARVSWLVIPLPIVSTRQFHGNKIMNSNQGFSGGSWTS